MDVLTTPQIITWGLAILSMVLAAVGYPYLKRRFFDPTMFLRAEIRTSPTKTKAVVVEKLDPVLATMPWEERTLFDGLRIDGGYTSVTLRNVDKKKLSNVTVTVAQTVLLNATYQINDEATLKAVKDMPIHVGDIQPGHNKVLHMWTTSDYSDYWFPSIKSMFSMSADELHSTRKTYPLPTYLRTRFVNSSIWIVNFALWGGGAVFCLAKLLTPSP
jgi:hypothetical protein